MDEEETNEVNTTEQILNKDQLFTFIDTKVNTQYMEDISKQINQKINQYNIDTSKPEYLKYNFWKSKLATCQDSLLYQDYEELRQFMFYSNLITNEVFELQQTIKLNFTQFNHNEISIEEIAYNIIIPYAYENGSSTSSDADAVLNNLSYKTNFINIIGFGKNLFYYLRYIIWLCRLKKFSKDELFDLPPDIKLRILGQTNFFIFCDNESADIYLKDIDNIRNQTEISDEIRLFPRHKNDVPTLELIESNNFTDYLNIFTSNAEFNQLYKDEIDFLKNININVYIVKSGHYLAKGIGAKRGLINFYNYNLCENIYSQHYIPTVTPDILELHKNNFCIMQLDDNITGIIDIASKDCTIGDAKKFICITKNDYDVVNKAHNNLNDTCDTGWSIFSIYNALRANCVTENNQMPNLIAGIRKGSGDRSKREDKNEALTANTTYAIYKLTIQKPYMLYSYGYFYNPFNCRFMEDIAFNALANMSYKSIKLNQFFLRFGHYNSEESHPDYNDCFDKSIIENPTNLSKPVYGVYLMLYYYLKLLQNVSLLEINISDIPWSYNMKFKPISNKIVTIPMIKPTVENKYNWMHMFIYQMFNIGWFIENFYFTNADNITNFSSVLMIEMKIIIYINKKKNDYLIENLNTFNYSYERLRPFLKLSVDSYYGKTIQANYTEKYLKYKKKYVELKKKTKELGL